MKILLSGGGTGGHLYPLIAIAEELNEISDEEKLLSMELYYMSDAPLDPAALEENFITFIPITAGKIRVTASLSNIKDYFKIIFGTLGAIWKVFRLYPDVVISKGGYASFPVLFAARILRIPVIVHESDTVPGRVTKWAGKFAKRVALSFPEAAEYFPKERIAYTGQPIRRSIATPAKEGGPTFFNFNDEIPVIGIIGGSLGARAINEAIVEILPELVKKYQIIHQTGEKHAKEVAQQSAIMLNNSQYKSRYKLYGSLGPLEMRMFASACDIVIARSGSFLFELSAWGTPSILIPYPLAHADHQKKNAYHYARAGACVVIEESNLNSSVLMHEIETLVENKEIHEIMSKHAKTFYKPNAARLIASEAISIALKHEK